MMRGVRALVIALVLGTVIAGCGGKSAGTTTSPQRARVATVFPSARFVPAQPTYVVSARTMREAQASYRHMLDMLAMVGGFEVSEIERDMTTVLGVNPLDPNAVAGIGIDLEGSVALFSEELDPTFVVHVTNADQMHGFLEGQRQNGMKTQSVVVAGTELFTARLANDAHISWALEKEWMWIHFSFGGQPDGPEWFEHSKQPTDTAWVDGWSWAKGQGASPIIGVLDAGAMLAKVGPHARDAAACLEKLASIRRVGMSFDIDAKQASARFAIDLGDASGRLRDILLPLPPGWAAASANAPVSAQWNVDLPATGEWLRACTGDEGVSATVAEMGVRSMRAFAHSLDIGDKEGVGAVAVDLSHARYFKAMLDQIPGRSVAESSRTYGQYKGKHVKVPFFIEADYVLNDQLMIGAMGKGMLERIGTGAAPSGPPPVLLVDIKPQGMPAGVWQDIFGLLEAPDPKRLTQRLMLWSELHADALLDGTSLVITTRGIRR